MRASSVFPGDEKLTVLISAFLVDSDLSPSTLEGDLGKIRPNKQDRQE